MSDTIKILLREKIEEMGDKPLINKFISFVVDHLGIEKCPKIILSSNRETFETTAYYNFIDHEVAVYVKGRAIIDVLRSLAHEMVHHQQNERGDLQGNKEEGADGSELENEANSKAGEIIRIFGRQNSELYN